MSFNETIIEPQNIEYQDTLVMYPYPIFGNIQNTGNRLQALADQTGVVIVASDLYLQNKKTIFDMAAREANQPEGETYVSMSQRRADFYARVAERLGATTSVGMGDSLAVSAIQGMQLHAEEEPFDALLLRDGWNLDAETTTFRGILRYVRYQIRDIQQQRKNKIKFDVPEVGFEKVPAEENETSMIAKLRNVSDMMRGSHNRDNALLLARQSDVAMKIVTLTNGLSSAYPSELVDFGRDLTIERGSRDWLGRAQRLDVKRFPGWHSDLIDPRRGAVDLRSALSLLS